MAQSRLAALHFILAAPAALMFPIGIALSMLYDRPLVAIVAALLWLAGVDPVPDPDHRPRFPARARPTLAAAE